jgi:hypothetical protein
MHVHSIDGHPNLGSTLEHPPTYLTVHLVLQVGEDSESSLCNDNEILGLASLPRLVWLSILMIKITTPTRRPKMIYARSGLTARWGMEK